VLQQTDKPVSAIINWLLLNVSISISLYCEQVCSEWAQRFY